MMLSFPAIPQAGSDSLPSQQALYQKTKENECPIKAIH